ncbi:MAG: phosphoribosylformylglycinamidine synthase subunit PurS [Bdellovibrionaceae bacterium]|nr:phosphoribosylformylglycinamidine synthase subunit PurS [Pseudobdellovibrionaceae bacterium]NUM58773.1 phosphoribosylformylglycinamidine synthase subunit PurS [Pseudobdellovibrionaceae bacterium]
MKVAVKILPREVLLDSQGRAVHDNLKNHQFHLNSCRVGKYIVLDLALENKEEALKEAKKMTEFLLINPLIESYQLEVLEESQSFHKN